MIPTSPERTGRSPRLFRLAAGAVVGVLVAASAAMAVAALERGPQVRAVTGDTALTVSQQGVTVTMRTDQPLDPSSVDGIRIEPDAPAQIDVKGASVRVRFTETLAFATDYRIIVPRLEGQATGSTSATEVAFTTPALTVTTLERGGTFERTGGDDDRVVRHDLSNDTEQVLISAPRIQEYADDGDDVVALTIDAAGASSLVHARPGEEPRPIPTPGSGDVRLLRASSDAGHLGYVYTGPSADGAESYLSALFMLDTTGDGSTPRVVVGLDGTPLQTAAWQFVPGSAYLVAQTTQGSLVLVDSTGAAPPRVLGELGDLRSFLPGTTSVVVGSFSGLSILDLTTGSLREIDGTAGGAIGSGALVVSADATVTWTPTEVTRSTAGGGAATVTRAATDERIEEVCVSPSGRHLAVGVVPGGAQIDGYPARADWQGRATDVVDVVSGETVARVVGTRPDWCA
ncbi:hypothetical protein QE410_000453 [Microbacterium sp. SORGH_AS 1204]|uniref:hypothetical protein n=1 Tax=Microbacterium sp. SORGH_AS_1204 TaxID=3041785 RepID=UPI00278D818F|nr:hypothetical protein [Microbacterium sp. SORGH_AS_1204]MDQ1135654.1 hypothetical protein [Microbacterium sp. SORGH_AS_1204]